MEKIRYRIKQVLSRVQNESRAGHATRVPNRFRNLTMSVFLTFAVCFSMYADDRDNTFIFHDGAEIEFDLGKIVAEGEMEVQFEVVDGQKRLKEVKSHGKTELIRFDKEQDPILTLVSPGYLHLDHHNQCVELQKDPDSKEQICYVDCMGKIFADKLELKYGFHNGSVQTSKLEMMGNVRLYNRFPTDKPDQEPNLQYAIADRMQYNPSTKEMTLTSNRKGRVLYFDKLNHLEMSAPALHLQRDPLTKKETLRGEGDVRFSFKKSELEKMNQQIQGSDDTKNT